MTVFRRFGLFVAALFLLAGCGSSATSAGDVVDQLGALYPAPNPRDNSASCADAGCESRTTTDAVTVTLWPDEATAQRARPLGGDEAGAVVGPYVLSYAGTEQEATSEQARQAYAAKVQEIVGANS